MRSRGKYVCFALNLRSFTSTNPFKNTMQRHRMIYSALSEEFEKGLHALSLNTKTEEEAQIKEA